MKFKKKLLFILVLLTFLFSLSNCYIEPTNSEDVFTIMKISAAAFYALAQFGRWITITNDYTSYEIYKIDVVPDSMTNIRPDGSTNYTRVIVRFNNKQNIFSYSFKGNLNVENLLTTAPSPGVYTFKLGFSFFTNISGFNYLISRAHGAGLTGNLEISKENFNLNFIITNLLYGTPNQPFMSSYQNSIKDISNVNPLYPKSGAALFAIGNYNNNNFSIYFKKENFNIAFVSYTNNPNWMSNLQGVIGSLDASLVIKGYNYDFKIKFNIESATITPVNLGNSFEVYLTNL